MSVVYQHSRNIDDAEPVVEVAPTLPPWVYSVGYRFDDECITLRVIVDRQLVAFEGDAEQMRALRDAIDRVLTHSTKTSPARVLDVPSSEPSA